MPLERDPEGTEITTIHDFVDFAGARVLEVGCGTGRLVWRYADTTRRVIGIDPDPSRLAQALDERPPALAGRVHFVKALAQQTPLPSASIDVGVLGWSL
jgi:ubiquinone/menaquinone biosynthesis C-methylase UbiE